MPEGQQRRSAGPGQTRLAAARKACTTPLLGRRPALPGGGDPMTRGWFNGPEECAGILAEITGGTPRTGRAFSTSWPWVDAGGAALGPALPVAVLAEESRGPDGFYRREGDSVIREACGRERPLITPSGAADGPPFEFEILWFGDAARYLVHDGALEVEDLFSHMRTSVSRTFLEQWLVGRLGCRPAILANLATPESATPETTLTVARGRAVTAATWNDPEAFFRRGVGFETVTASACGIAAHGPGRLPVEYSLSMLGCGWSAALVAGVAPFERFSVVRDDPDVVLTATIAAGIDPLAAGTRERLTFDLLSFLVSL